jgi:imidazolonepropionase-like amidohydrolase
MERGTAERRAGAGKRAAVGLTAALLLAGCRVETWSPPVSVAGSLALVHGTLISGTGAAPVADAALVMDGPTITWAGPRSRVLIPEGATIVDVGGATMLPGFINAHVHDAYSAGNLEAWAWAGVTTVRDEGILRSGVTLQALIAQRDAEWTAPRYARLVATGWMITAPGGYGRLGVADAAEARQAATDELDQGADQLKVAVEDGIAGQTDLPVLSAPALAAVVEVAHRRGTRVSAHVTDAALLPRILDAGVDDAAHVTWDPVPDAVYRRMIGLGIAMVPTLTVQEAYGALAGAQANLRRFVALGGRVALGNDYTDIPQNGFPHFELGMPAWEIRRMAEAGMTPMQVVVAATREAARVCGLGERLGTLEAGKLADVLVVDGDPLRDLSALAAVRLVIHGGVVIRGAP